MSDQPSCDELIGKRLEDRLESLSPDCQDCQEGYCDDHTYGAGVLDVSKAIVYTILLSTGGPHDEFRVTVDHGEIVRIEYRYLDWYDGASRFLSGYEFDQVEAWIHSQIYIEEIM